MEQIPFWEPNRFSASQEIPHILWNQKVHYRIHKCPPPVPILSQIHSIHSSLPLFLNIHLIIIFSSTRGFSKWSLSLIFSHQNPVYTSPLPHTCYMHRPTHSSLFDHPNNIVWRYRLLSSSLCSFLHSPVTTSLWGNLFSNTLSLPPYLNVSHQVSHPYKTICKIRFLCV